VFAEDLWTKPEDFLILGTHYVQESELTARNTGVLFDAIREDGPRVVALLTAISAMTAAGYSIGDPEDERVPNVVGLDASLPMIVNGFVRGGDDQAP
jgi:hypothetical protein